MHVNICRSKLLPSTTKQPFRGKYQLCWTVVIMHWTSPCTWYCSIELQAGHTHTHTQIQRAASSHPPFRGPRKLWLRTLTGSSCWKYQEKSMYTVTLVHMHAHTAASVLGETQNLLSVLKRKAAVCKVLLQTCAQVQEEKIKSADANKEKNLKFDFLKSPANRMGLGLD